MRTSVTLPPNSEILTWLRPKSDALPIRSRKRYEDRVKALEAVIKGSTFQAAADLYGVDRELIAQMLATAQTLDLKGKPYGFRACLPYSRTALPVPGSADVPLAAAPHAFAQLVRAVPEVATVLDDFKGELPTRNRRSAAFNRLMGDIKRILERANLGHAFPLNTPDKGRRAVLEWLKRVRHREEEQDIKSSTDAPVSVTRLDQVLRLKPFDRAETDEHWTDVSWHGLVPTPKGGWCSVPLSGIWFIATVDSVLPMVYAWTLVVGRSFNEQDFLRVQSKALTPWKRRNLIVPDLYYHERAWMPNAVESFPYVLRACTQAADNHASHTSRLVLANFRNYQVGVLNHGYSEVPEGRPNIEALFNFVEEEVFRPMAGGFRPAKSFGDEPERVGKLRPSDHPIELVALEDYVDVMISRFHALPRPSLQNRSVREVVEFELANGLWPTQSRLTENDAADLVSRSLVAKICGDGEGEPLHVNFLDGTYRHDSLDKKTLFAGKKFHATVPFSDASRMTLYDEEGDVFAVLHARPPWSRPHTLEERERARQWLKRGIFAVGDDGDAVGAYHRCVRKLASTLQWAADLFVKDQSGHTSSGAANDAPPTAKLPADTLKGMTPRRGHVGLLMQVPKK